MMITGDDLVTANRYVAGRDPDQVCAELDLDPAGVREAMEGLGFGRSEEVRGTIAIALLVGIRAGREASP